MSDSVRPHRRQPTRLPRPWDSPGKNTGVGCHFLLQCMKVKSERELLYLFFILSHPPLGELPIMEHSAGYLHSDSACPDSQRGCHAHGQWISGLGLRFLLPSRSWSQGCRSARPLIMGQGSKARNPCSWTYVLEQIL